MLYLILNLKYAGEYNDSPYYMNYNLDHSISIMKHEELKSGSKGLFRSKIGDYILWTPETNNILIE